MALTGLENCVSLADLCFQTPAMVLSSGHLPPLLLSNLTSLKKREELEAVIAGLLTFRDAGNFDLCIGLEAAHYCGVGLAWGPELGLCLPLGCNSRSLQALVECGESGLEAAANRTGNKFFLLAEYLYGVATSVRGSYCVDESSFGTPVREGHSDGSSKWSSIDAGGIITLTFLGMLILCVLVATIWELAEASPSVLCFKAWLQKLKGQRLKEEPMARGGQTDEEEAAGPTPVTWLSDANKLIAEDECGARQAPVEAAVEPRVAPSIAPFVEPVEETLEDDCSEEDSFEVDSFEDSFAACFVGDGRPLPSYSALLTRAALVSPPPASAPLSLPALPPVSSLPPPPLPLFVRAFSARTGASRLFDLSEPSRPTDCLDGVRVLSTGCEARGRDIQKEINAAMAAALVLSY